MTVTFYEMLGYLAVRKLHIHPFYPRPAFRLLVMSAVVLTGPLAG